MTCNQFIQENRTFAINCGYPFYNCSTSSINCYRCIFRDTTNDKSITLKCCFWFWESSSNSSCNLFTKMIFSYIVARKSHRTEFRYNSYRISWKGYFRFFGQKEISGATIAHLQHKCGIIRGRNLYRNQQQECCKKMFYIWSQKY